MGLITNLFKTNYEPLDQIIQDEKFLRKPSKLTSIRECENLDLFKHMDKVLNNQNREFPGYALCAIQIGLPIRAMIIRDGKHNFNVINPKIVEFKNPVKFQSEGCLSFPWAYINTQRFDEVMVEWTDAETNTSKLWKFKGLVAAIWQHEIDHMDGILYTDRKLVPILTDGKIGRNQLCPCGSGKKYKKCCENEKE